MTPDIVEVKALPDYKLQVLFENGELKSFDMIPYLDYQAFSGLRDDNLFLSARVLNGTVAWTDEIDISPDTLYLKSNAVTATEFHMGVQQEIQTVHEEQSLYDVDYNLWVLSTVEALKNKEFSSLDLENLIDEVLDLSRRDKKKLKSLLKHLIEHFLKWEHPS